MNNMIFFNSIAQPKGILPYAILIILILVIAIAMVPLFGTFLAMKKTSISLTDKEVIIKSIFYSKKIPLENIVIDDIKAINLNENSEYKVSIKTFGIGLPGVKMGWMRLKNGKKALVYITNYDNVLLLPTKDFIVLFSMDNIEDFISKIERASIACSKNL